MLCEGLCHTCRQFPATEGGESLTAMDNDLAGILERLKAVRAKSAVLGRDYERLMANLGEAVARINQARSALEETKARLAHERSRLS